MKALPGILLAAGFSRRMGGRCKLLLPLEGRPLVAHAARAALEGGLDPVVLVTGPHTPPEVRASCLAEEQGRQHKVFHVTTATRAAQGQAESLKAGLALVLELTPDAPGVMVLLGDQPLVDAPLIRRLASAFLTAYHEREHAFCAAPRAENGSRGNPVVIHAAFFAEVFRLSGDVGARSIVKANPLLDVSCSGDSCLADADTPEAYARLVRRASTP